jgi:hypothetical protein
MRKMLTKRPRVSVAQIEAARALLRETGLSSIEIAAATGVSDWRVQKEAQMIVRPENLMQAARRQRARDAAKTKAPKPVRVDRERICALLRAGHSVTEAAVEMGCSTSTVSAVRRAMEATDGATYRRAAGLVHDECANADTERI